MDENTPSPIYMGHEGGVLTLRKETWLNLALGLCVIAMVTGGLHLALRSNMAQPSFLYAGDDSRPVIILDAGHGGTDGGAVGKNGVLEKKINLAVAQKSELLLVLLGCSVRMTRSTDADLSGYATEDPSVSIGHRKVLDMRARVALINGQPNALLLSIHMNSFPKSKYSGAQVFYSKNNPSSPVLAGQVQTALSQVLNPANTRLPKQAEDSIYLMKSVQCPAVIVECGFLSNPEEAVKLTSEDYQRKIAVSITVAVLSYLAEGGGV